MLAAALRDTDRAVAYGHDNHGERFGQVTPLSFGGALRASAARYKSPDGYLIDNVGVSPNITVTVREGASDDNQKTFAIETAGSLV